MQRKTSRGSNKMCTFHAAICNVRVAMPVVRAEATVAAIYSILAVAFIITRIAVLVQSATLTAWLIRDDSLKIYIFQIAGIYPTRVKITCVEIIIL